MANRETLHNYLVGDKGYLLDSNNNHKAIMLSGKWGSGKTYFWKEDIKPSLDKSKIPNHYISLYGKTSIEQIKTEIFTEIFQNSNSPELEKKVLNTVKESVEVVSSIAKTISIFGLNIDLSRVTEKPFEILENTLDNVKLKDTINYLNSGAIICFDDFERKSKDIDLNDLFGFISQLTIEFKCKVVIILNDDVFEGEEKKVFSNVKEKTISKFLNYNPTIDELFDLIYDSNEKKYKELDNSKEVILETIKETEVLNARIYIQVLDNLLEWNDKTNISNENFIKYFIYININFILHHNYLYAHFITVGSYKGYFGIEIVRSSLDEISLYIKTEITLPKNLNKYLENSRNLTNLKVVIKSDENTYSESQSNYTDKSEIYIDFINKNEKLIESILFLNRINLKKSIESNNQAECDILNKINAFIKTGILPNA